MRMKFRSQLVALALGAALGTPALAQNVPFYDLPDTHWAYDSVRQLTDLGILTGYPDGRFDGTRAATRYEISVIAARLLEYASGDVPTGGTASALSNRLGTVENALRNASSLAYTQRLETRISALETALDLEATAPEQSDEDAAALNPTNQAATPPANSGGAGKSEQIGLRLVDIQFSARPEYPFFIGISPGVISTVVTFI